jgi:hypothetical protein
MDNFFGSLAIGTGLLIAAVLGPFNAHGIASTTKPTGFVQHAITASGLHRACIRTRNCIHAHDKRCHQDRSQSSMANIFDQY